MGWRRVRPKAEATASTFSYYSSGEMLTAGAAEVLVRAERDGGIPETLRQWIDSSWQRPFLGLGTECATASPLRCGILPSHAGRGDISTMSKSTVFSHMEGLWAAGQCQGRTGGLAGSDE